MPAGRPLVGTSSNGANPLPIDRRDRYGDLIRDFNTGNSPKKNRVRVGRFSCEEGRTGNSQ